MTDPSKAYLQAKQPSPKTLDDQILAAAKDQAELNSASRKFVVGNWIQTAAFASVCLVGLSLVFDPQFTHVSDPYAEYAELQSLSEIQLQAAQPSLNEYDFAVANDLSIAAGSEQLALESAPEPVIENQGVSALEESLVSAGPLEASIEDNYFASADRARAALGNEAEKTIQSRDSAIQDDAVIESVSSAVSAFADFADSAEMANPNPNLVNLIDHISNFTYDLRYLGENNFVGRPIDGYLDEVVLLSAEAAEALARVQIAANRQGLGVKVFDAYRPQRAVDHFVRWAQDLNDQSTKQDFYPYVDKAELFQQGYIAEQSGHSRGSTLDLTLIDLATGIELDMGTPFDFFDPLSWPLSEEVSQPVQQNRLLLRSLMLEQGFIPYEAEWWHFTLANEPYSDQYFDLPVE